jgi:hypothetical protein
MREAAARAAPTAPKQPAAAPHALIQRCYPAAAVIDPWPAVEHTGYTQCFCESKSVSPAWLTTRIVPTTIPPESTPSTNKQHTTTHSFNHSFIHNLTLSLTWNHSSHQVAGGLRSVDASGPPSFATCQVAVAHTRSNSRGGGSARMVLPPVCVVHVWAGWMGSYTHGSVNAFNQPGKWLGLLGR